MKAKKDLRKGALSSDHSDQDSKGKKLVPEKKVKNEKRALFQEIEEDEEIDYLSIKEHDSIEDYFDDDEELDEEFDEEFDDDELDDIDEEFDDEDEEE